MEQISRRSNATCCGRHRYKQKYIFMAVSASKGVINYNMTLFVLRGILLKRLLKNRSFFAIVEALCNVGRNKQDFGIEMLLHSL